jgi:hypothetical protein
VIYKPADEEPTDTQEMEKMFSFMPSNTINVNKQTEPIIREATLRDPLETAVGTTRHTFQHDAGLPLHGEPSEIESQNETRFVLASLRVSEAHPEPLTRPMTEVQLVDEFPIEELVDQEKEEAKELRSSGVQLHSSEIVITLKTIETGSSVVSKAPVNRRETDNDEEIQVSNKIES